MQLASFAIALWLVIASLLPSPAAAEDLAAWAVLPAAAPGSLAPDEAAAIAWAILPPEPDSDSLAGAAGSVAWAVLPVEELTPAPAPLVLPAAPRVVVGTAPFHCPPCEALQADLKRRGVVFDVVQTESGPWPQLFVDDRRYEGYYPHLLDALFERRKSLAGGSPTVGGP